MEKPRPSPNLGKLISIRETFARRAATLAGSSCGSSRMTSPSGSEGGVATTRRSLISVAIDSRFKRFDADTMHEVDEALHLAVSLLQIELDQLLDDVGNLGAGER